MSILEDIDPESRSLGGSPALKGRQSTITSRTRAEELLPGSTSMCLGMEAWLKLYSSYLVGAKP
jgi:hypothetical protein